jgi:PAS domain S-box-containing protein
MKAGKTNRKKKTEIDLTVYKRMLENIHDAFMVSQDGQTKYVNSKILELLGYDKEEEVLNKGFDFLVNPEDYPRVLSNHQRRLRGEQLDAVYEFRILRKNGESIPVEIRVNIFEWEGRPATLNFLIDITERKKIQQILQESENTYRTIFENTGTAMAIADENRRPILVNDEMCKLTGYTREELSDEKADWSSFTVSQDVERLKGYHRQRLANPALVPRHYEYQVITKNREFKDVFMTSELIPQTRKSLVSMIDITGRKKAEKELQKSEECLRELFLNSLDIISVFDKDGMFLYSSPSLTRITGYREEDIIGRSCFNFIHPDDSKLVVNAFTEVVDFKNDNIVTEFRFRHSDGSWIYLEALGNNCVDNSVINGIIINARDITERKLLEEQLLQAQKWKQSALWPEASRTISTICLWELKGIFP